MTSINFNNSYKFNNPQAQNAGVSFQQMPQQQQQQQSFEALDKKQLQQDAVQIANQEKDVANNNPLLSMLNIDLKNPKKTLTSIGLMTITTLVIAGLFNKNVGKIADLGQKVDDVLLNNKTYKKVAGALSNAKDSVVKFVRKNKTIDDIFDTLKNRKAKPVSLQARGMGQGCGSMFSITPGENISNAISSRKKPVVKALKQQLKDNGLGFFDRRKVAKIVMQDEAEGLKIVEQVLGKSSAADIKSKLTSANDDILKSLKGLVGDKKADALLKEITDGAQDNQEFCKKLTKTIAERFNLTTAAGEVDQKKLNAFLQQVKKDGFAELNGTKIDLSDFVGINMTDGGIIGSWGPINLINGIGKKIGGNKWKDIGRGNLFDALLKYNMVTNGMAKTAPGRLIQKTVGAADVISNHVNDKSTMGFLACFMGMSAFANMYDAPKGKKFSTMSNDFANQVTGLMITTPMAFAATYGLASMRNLKGNNIGSKVLRNTVGRIFHIGLGKKADPAKLISSTYQAIKTGNGKIATDALKRVPKATLSKIAGIGGGAMRFALIMLVFGSLFAQPVNKLVQKVFGKPYDPAEEEAEAQKKAQAEAMKNNPNMNLTEEQALKRLQAHPEVVQAIQNDPKMMAAIQKDPSLLLQIIASLPDVPAQNTQTNSQSSFNIRNSQSQLLRNYLNKQNPSQPMQQNPFVQNQPAANGGVQSPYGNIPQPQVTNYNMPSPQTNNMQQAQTTQKQQDEAPEPVRTYIPSSKPVTISNAVVAEGESITNPNVQSILAKADKAEAEAMRYF